MRYYIWYYSGGGKWIMSEKNIGYGYSDLNDAYRNMYQAFSLSYIIAFHYCVAETRPTHIPE